MIKDVILPEVSENVESGEIVKILVAVGDAIENGQSILELETDKAVLDVPSPAKGVVKELAVSEGETIKIGQVILRLDTGAQSAAEAAADENPPPAGEIDRAEEMVEPAATTTPKAGPQPDPSPTEPSKLPPVKSTLVSASPSVRRLARELGVDIETVDGSGKDGRISAGDVKNFVRRSNIGPAVGKAAPTPGGIALPDFSRFGEIELIPLSQIRRITAENVAVAWNTIPQVTQFDEADVTELERFRGDFGPMVEAQGGKLTITAILVKVIAAALKVYPQFNASIDMAAGQIVLKNYFNIGVAVDTDHGLLVPVLKNVNRKNIIEISVELTDLSERARSRKITPAEMEGGNFTISNLGGIGGTNFSPIVFWPQVAILAVSRGKWQQHYKGGNFEPRMILPLGLSYDHRLIDGADAARFLRWVANALENPLLISLEG